MTMTVVDALWYTLCACSAVAVVENLLVIVVLVSTSQLRLKYYDFVFNLALSDLLFSAFHVANSLTRFPVVLAFVQAWYFVSLLTILAVAVNRYLALSLMPPARYDALVTRGRLVIFCLCLWLSSFLLYVLPVLLAPDDIRDLISGLVRPLAVFAIWIITAALYCLVFRKIKRYAVPLVSSAPTDPAAAPRVGTRVRQTRQMLTTFTVILVVTFLCWVPFNAIKIIRHANPSLYSKMSFRAYYLSAAIVNSLTSNIDPLIYWWRMKEFRNGFYAVFCRRWSKTESTKRVQAHALEETISLDTSL